MFRPLCAAGLAVLLLALGPAVTASPHRHGPVHYGTGPAHQHGPVHYGNGPDHRAPLSIHGTRREADTAHRGLLLRRGRSPVIIVEPRVHLDRHRRFGHPRLRYRAPRHGLRDHPRLRYRAPRHGLRGDRGDPPWWIVPGAPSRHPRRVP